jgi:hypothetical protein
MKINSVGLLELETADLECFLEKASLSPLGVKRGKRLLPRQQLKHPMQRFFFHFF